MSRSYKKTPWCGDHKGKSKKYGRWDSNPQGSKPGDFKSPMFTDFITPAYR